MLTYWTYDAVTGNLQVFLVNHCTKTQADGASLITLKKVSEYERLLRQDRLLGH